MQYPDHVHGTHHTYCAPVAQCFGGGSNQALVLVVWQPSQHVHGLIAEQGNLHSTAQHNVQPDQHLLGLAAKQGDLCSTAQHSTMYSIVSMCISSLQGKSRDAHSAV